MHLNLGGVYWVFRQRIIADNRIFSTCSILPTLKEVKLYKAKIIDLLLLWARLFVITKEN